MSSPFVAEIRMFPFNFAPTGWAFCDGQLIPLAQNTALFSLLGTTYGGNGLSTFALPNLQGAAPMHAGGSSGPGLSQRFLGEQNGTDTVTLLPTEMPNHSHLPSASAVDGIEQTPGASKYASGIGIATQFAGATNLSLSPNAIAPVGSGLPHNNMMPYLTVSFCIALQGIFPQRG